MSDARLHLLLVESDEATRRFLRLLLEGEGYQVTIATSIAEAAALLEQAAIDLVLTDSFSATADGIFLATAPLRRLAGSRPVLLLTGHRLDGQEARGAGFAAVLRKPFDIDDLLGLLQNLVPTPAV